MNATLGAGRLLDRKTTGVALTARAVHITGALEAGAKLTGDIDGQPLTGSAYVAKRADGGWTLDNLALSLASASLSGGLAIGADHIVVGDMAFGAKNLDDLSPLVLTRLGGALQAKIAASGGGGRQSVAIVAMSDRMSVGDNRLEGLKVNVAVADLWGARAISGSAALARAAVAGQSIAEVKLTATPGADFSDIDASGVARGLTLKARGRLFGGTPVRLDLATLSAEGGGRRIALAGPATLVFDSGVEFRNFTLAVDSGRLSLAGRAGKTLDLRARATALPLSALDMVSPGLGLSGVAEGEATISGPSDSPTGDWQARATGISAAQVRSAGLPCARHRGIRTARRRSHHGRSHAQGRRGLVAARLRLGPAFARRRARPQARRAARCGARQCHAVDRRTERQRRDHGRDAGARQRSRSPTRAARSRSPTAPSATIRPASRFRRSARSSRRTAIRSVSTA